MTLHIVSSTRVPQSEFGGTALGRSILRLRKPPKLSIEYENVGRLGLPEVYNAALQTADPSDTMLFVHDDVLLGDLDVVDTLEAALRRFDVVGVAGGKHRAAGQATWFGPLDTFEKSIRAGRLSGAVSHVLPKGEAVFSVYGPAPQEVKLLDGLFIAVMAASLRAQRRGPGEPCRFDPQFRYHLYDIDFCRSAELNGLSLGTWFIPIIHFHEYGDGYRTPEWREAADLYLKKWEGP